MGRQWGAGRGEKWSEAFPVNMKAETQTQQRRTALLGKQENRERETAGNCRTPPPPTRQGSSKEYSHSSEDVAEEVSQEMGKETLKQKGKEKQGSKRAELNLEREKKK